MFTLFHNWISENVLMVEEEMWEGFILWGLWISVPIDNPSSSFWDIWLKMKFVNLMLVLEEKLGDHH